MPLTPDDVSNKRFTPVRLREGYDMGEVDQFLDEVEAELARLIRENDDLREQVRVAEDNAASGASAADAPAAPVDAPETPAVEDEPAAKPGPEKPSLPEETQAVAAVPPASLPGSQTPPAPVAETAVEATPTSTSVSGPQEIRVSTVPEASAAAARLLEIATNNAEQLVGEARAEAEQILTTAQAEADRVQGESKTKADKIESDARSRSQMLDSETTERRTKLVGDLEKERGRLNGEIETLRTFEREYRSRLKNYFTQQLNALETGDGSEGGLSPLASAERPPKRLRSLLGEEDGV
ncbi:DivIVA domain-containing protein [Marmoricola endophyticus]|nr:DivIVA domain-containing protein [Marmoricola endophyticus]